MAEGYIDTGKITGTFTLNDDFTSYFEIMDQKIDTINGVFVRICIKLRTLQQITSGEKKIGKITNVQFKENINWGAGCIINNGNTSFIGGALTSGNDFYINCQSNVSQNQTLDIMVVA